MAFVNITWGHFFVLSSTFPFPPPEYDNRTVERQLTLSWLNDGAA